MGKVGLIVQLHRGRRAFQKVWKLENAVPGDGRWNNGTVAGRRKKGPKIAQAKRPRMGRLAGQGVEVACTLQNVKAVTRIRGKM